MGFYAAQGSDYSDSSTAESETIGLSVMSRPNVHGQLRFTCTGPTIQVRLMADYVLNDNKGKVAIWVDGAFSSAITPTANLAWYTVTIPSGPHLVEIQAGQQSGASFPTSVTGTWADAINAPNLRVLPQATSTKWLVFEGDSIADGQPTTPGGDDFVTLVRAMVAPFGWRVACYSYGFRSLFDESNQAAVAARLDRMCPGGTQIRIINQLGTNDYGLPKQSAANYGTEYAARIAACQTQFGSRLDKYIVLTPFTREVESANSFGNTLPQYRSQGAAQAGGNVIVIDGPSAGLVIPTDYDDSPALHPNSLGHSKIASFLFPRVIA